LEHYFGKKNVSAIAGKGLYIFGGKIKTDEALRFVDSVFKY
jgi:hypothetical protein